MTYVVGLRPPSAVQVDDVRRVYASAFGPPPYGERATEVAAGVARFLDHAQKEGFRLATAWLDDGLVGFSYGNLCGPDGAFARFAIRDLGPERAACWVSGRFFELVELAVDPPHHGHGLGRRCTTWCSPRSTLRMRCSLPIATPLPLAGCTQAPGGASSTRRPTGGNRWS